MLLGLLHWSYIIADIPHFDLPVLCNEPLDLIFAAAAVSDSDPLRSTNLLNPAGQLAFIGG